MLTVPSNIFFFQLREPYSVVQLLAERVDLPKLLDLQLPSGTLVGDNINIMITTFNLNFDLYHAFKQH